MQTLYVDCLTGDGSKLVLHDSPDTARAIWCVIGEESVFIKPISIVIAALTLASDAERAELIARINALNHPGPKGN